MKKQQRESKSKCIGLLSIYIFFLSVSSAFSTVVVDHTHTELDVIPDQWITRVKSDLHIAYNHTSHGSQLIAGMVGSGLAIF